MDVPKGTQPYQEEVKFAERDISYQGCQIKKLQIGSFLSEFGKFRKKYLANSEKIPKAVVQP
jgi:hypothetical protein